MLRMRRPRRGETRACGNLGPAPGERRTVRTLRLVDLIDIRTQVNRRPGRVGSSAPEDLSTWFRAGGIDATARLPYPSRP